MASRSYSRSGYTDITSLINGDGTDATTDSVKEVDETDEDVEEIESTENNTDSSDPFDTGEDEASEIIKDSTKEDSEDEEVAETEVNEDNADGIDSSVKDDENEKIEIPTDSTKEGDKDEEVEVKEGEDCEETQTTEDSVDGDSSKKGDTDEKVESSTDSGKDEEEVDEDRSTNAVANEDGSADTHGCEDEHDDEAQRQTDEFVLAYLRQRDLSSAAEDVSKWIQRATNGGAVVTSVPPPFPVHVSSSATAGSISSPNRGIGNTSSIAKTKAMEDPKKDPYHTNGVYVSGQRNLKYDDAKYQGDNASMEMCNDSIFSESTNNDAGGKMSYVEQIILQRVARYADTSISGTTGENAQNIDVEAGMTTSSTGNSDAGTPVATEATTAISSESGTETNTSYTSGTNVPAEAGADITANTGNSDVGSSVAVATASAVSSESDIEAGDLSWPDLQRSITESAADIRPGAYAVGNSQSQPNGPERRPELRRLLSRYQSEDDVAEAETESSNSVAEVAGESQSDTVVTVVEATIVDDVVVEASVVGKDDGARGWSKRCTLAASLTVLAVIALISGIVVGLDNGSELPPDIAAILALGEGEACVNTNPTKCACYNGDGYLGTINTTASGVPCQRWDSQTPHQHTMELSERHPNLDENYCRSTDSYPSPWCYTADPDTRWEYCTVPQCESYTVPIALSEVESFPPSDPFCSQDSRQPEETTSGLYLDGISNHVVITNSSFTALNLAGGPFTIETWVKPSEKSDFSTILSNKEAGAGKSGFIFSINAWKQSNARLYFEGTYSRMASSVSLQWDIWQHVAVTYDGESSLIFYLDGDQIPHYPTDGYYAPLSIKRSYLDTKIGEVARYYDGAITAENNSHFKGVIDELRVWNHVRSPHDIRLSMDCEGVASEPGLLAYYQFNEERKQQSADRLVVHDSSPNGNNGVIIDDTAQIQENGDNFGEISQGSRYTQGIALCTDCSSI